MKYDDIRGILRYVPQFRGQTFVVLVDSSLMAHENLQNVLLDLAVFDQDIGMRLLERIRDELADVSVVEHMPKLEGRQMIMVLAPKRK